MPEKGQHLYLSWSLITKFVQFLLVSAGHSFLSALDDTQIKLSGEFESLIFSPISVV